MSNINKISRRTLVVSGGAGLMSACSGGMINIGGIENRDYSEIDQQSAQVRQNLFAHYPSARNVANLAAGHLIMPYIGKAGLIFGGTHGKGAMYVRDNIVGHYQMTALSWGLQLGVQSFSMAMFFMTAEALAKFRQSSGVEFGSDIEYALPNQGLSIGASSATFNQPVYALVFNQSGILAGASIEGAKWSAY